MERWGFKFLRRKGCASDTYVDDCGNEFKIGKTVSDPDGILFANDENGLRWDVERGKKMTEIGCFLVEDPVVPKDEFRKYQTKDGNCEFFYDATLVFIGVDNALKYGLKVHKFEDGKANSILFYWAVMHTKAATIEKLAELGLYHQRGERLATDELLNAEGEAVRRRGIVEALASARESMEDLDCDD
jgi:hypothetical protein